MLDWEGKIASTVFLPRCNFRCPFCQNPELVLHPEKLDTVSLETFEGFLKEREGWIDGVCITGGEPCLHKELPDFCTRIKELGFGVKLDTNGSFPEMLDGLLEGGTVDFVAMDVKAPLEEGPYRIAAGTEQADLVERVGRSIELLKASKVEHEFRTTVVPILHSPEDVAKIARILAGERYALQYFSPNSTLDPRYSELKPFSEEDMAAMVSEARRFVENTIVRGAPSGIE